MSLIRHILPQGERLHWQARAGQHLEVGRGQVEVEEMLWVDSQLLHSRQRLGPGSCYVLHSSGWVTVVGVSAAHVWLPPATPSRKGRVLGVAQWLWRVWRRARWPGRGAAAQMCAASD